MEARDIVSRALRLLSVIASGENASGTDASDALSALNLMVDNWNTRPTYLHKRKSYTYTLPAPANSLTIGAGGAFVIDPASYIEALLIDRNGVKYALRDKPVTWWQTQNSANTEVMYYRIEEGYPLRTVHLNALAPAQSIMTLWYKEALSQFSSLDHTLNHLPPGYAKAMTYSLAVELAPEYGVAISNTLYERAVDTVSDIRRKNIDDSVEHASTKPDIMKGSIEPWQ